MTTIPEQVLNHSNAKQTEFQAPSTGYHLDDTEFVVYAANCALNVVLSLAATLGNFVVLLALRKTSALHSPSKALLSNLALSDLAIGLIAQPIFVIYAVSSLTKGTLQVKTNLVIAITILSLLLSSVSLLTMTVISTDRFLALLLKTRYRQEVTVTRVIAVLFGVWLLGAAVATVNHFNSEKGKVIALGLLLFCVATTSFNYFNIYRLMRQHRGRVFVHVEHASDGTVPDLRMTRFRRSVSGALYVYLALLLCCLPYLCVALVSLFYDWSTALVVSRHISETVMYLNSSLNPLLYCWTSRDMRRATWRTLKHPCGV